MSFIDHLSILKKKLNCFKKSYSFGSVDLLVNYFFKYKKKGIYLDVGCQHPVSNNNTYLLYKKGWSGVNIDLDKKSIDLFNLVRKKDININTAISSGVSEKKLYFYHDKSAINTLNKEVSNFQSAKVKEVRTIKTNSLNNILEQNNINKIDYLNIDVEGHEIDVLLGLDIRKYLPDIVSIEYLDLTMGRLEFKNNKLQNVINSDIYKYMDSKGYSLINWNHADLIFINNDLRD
jgi:FkbM family methyltransferase